MVAFCDRTRLLIEPPLNIPDDQLDRVIAVLGESVKGVAAPNPV
jgi:hypothetical protein